MSLRSNLKEKLENEQYFNSLSERKQKELLFCKEILSEEELLTLSSIQVAYNKAREIFIDNYLYKINPIFAEQVKEKKLPIFNKEEILKQFE